MTEDKLPGEGEMVVVVKTRKRHECEICGNPAAYKHTFLLNGARANPASSAYGRNDCLWCQDDARYVCAEHKNECRAPDGYEWCSTFEAKKHLAHLFLYWDEKEHKEHGDGD